MAKRKKFSTKQVAAKYGFRSGLEMQIDEALKTKGIDGEYERHVINYVRPATYHRYHPDFRLPNGIFVETKGRFLAADRKKHLLIKKQYPDLDIRFLFQNSRARISKTSKTTYADWCVKNGFQFADKEIPESWLEN